ncbi:uncharacterized protein [Nicotiana tomentosiformis]|uniref:uncharacterized protein n=1 Tax=Nicotiana tomentosiformis TaxID=4098 RepID=UPI00388CD411
MKIALLGKRKLGFVTNTFPKESCEKILHEQWETCNAIVLSWLMNTMSTKLLSRIVYASNAHLAWEDLRERFDKVNRMRIYQIHRAIATLSQGTDFVSTYFTKLKGLLNEYDAMAYAMVTKDESQHSSSGLSSLSENNDPMAMQVDRGQGYREKKPFMQCEHYGLRGHTKENYHKIIGYPEDFKGEKKFSNNNTRGQFRRGNGNFGGQSGTQQSINVVNNICGSADVQSQSSSTADLQTTLAGKGPYFTEMQYKQILGPLSKDTNDSQANMVGIATCLMTSSFTNEWIVDSSVTHHITSTENLLKVEFMLGRLPSIAIKGKSPYKMLYSKSPSLNHLRVIGYLCYATTVRKGDKFAARTRPAVLMGFSERQKVYLLLELDSKQLFVSRDIVFKELEFPFAANMDTDHS